MEKILKLKHWQVFTLLIFSLILSNFTLANSPLTTMIIKIIGIALYFLYPFLIGVNLQNSVPKPIELNFNFFVINSFIWITAYLIIMVLSDGKGMEFTGFAAIPMFYVFFALLYSLAFPAKAIKSIELNKQASFGDYFGDFMLIIILPIGIWFLQPRINRIANMKENNNN